MEILFLIGLNLLVVPFLQQAERLGRMRGRWPRTRDILLLADVRQAFWFKPFCVASAVFLACVFGCIWVLRVEIALAVPINFGIMQVLLWGAVVLEIHAERDRRRRSAPVGNERQGVVPSTGIEPVSES